MKPNEVAIDRIDSVLAAPAGGESRGRRARRWLGGRREFRYAGLVTFATLAGQLVLLATAPILARLFTPSDFGHLTLLLTSSTIGGSVAAFCYHFAILLPRSPRMAAAAYRLSVYASFAGALLATLIYWLVVPDGHAAFPGMPLWLDLSLIYGGILLTSLFNVLGTAHSRADQFRAVAWSKFNLSFFSTLAQIVFGLGAMKLMGLQAGRLVGVLATVAAMGRGLPPGMSIAALLSPRWRELRIVARRYRDSILHIPRELLMRAGTGLPPVMLLASFGPATAGLFFFAERLIERPGMLLSDALTRIPMKMFAENVQNRKPIVTLALIYAALCSLIVLIGIALVVLGGRWLFGLVFGDAWIEAADYATALAVGTGIRIGILPVAALVPVLRIQSKVVLIDAVFFARVLVIPLAAWLGYSAIAAVGAFAGLSVIYSLATFTVALRAARAYERTLPASGASRR